MSTGKSFDDLSRRLGNATTRREAFVQSFRCLAMLIAARLGIGNAYADSSDTSELLEFYDSDLYTCSATSQVKLTLSEDGKPNVVPSGCIYDIQCLGKDRRAKYKSKPFISFCRLDGDHCKDFHDCIAEQRIEFKNPTMTFLKAELEKKEPIQALKETYGQECQYSWGIPLVLYRQIPGTDVWDTVCASPISGCKLPASLKGSFVATCKSTRQIKPGLMECPAPQNCLANAIPVTPALTKSQAVPQSR